MFWSLVLIQGFHWGILYKNVGGGIPVCAVWLAVLFSGKRSGFVAEVPEFLQTARNKQNKQTNKHTTDG